MDFLLKDCLPIVISSVSVYLFIVVAIRLFGKKEISQLSVIDLVFILLISNAVQNAMVGNNTTLWGGLVAATALFAVNYLLKQVVYRFPAFGKMLQGEAVILVYKGQMKIENMYHARISHAELMEAAREHGVATIEEINLAVLEMDGNISILSHEFHQKTTHKRKGRKVISYQQ